MPLGTGRGSVSGYPAIWEFPTLTRVPAFSREGQTPLREGELALARRVAAEVAVAACRVAAQRLLLRPSADLPLAAPLVLDLAAHHVAGERRRRVEAVPAARLARSGARVAQL